MTTLLPVAELSQLSFMRTRGVLRTTQDQSLNDIVRVAAHALRSPMALVSLVDEDRQWFKAGHGIEHGGSDAGLPAYTHAVGGVFTPAVTLIFGLKTLFFGLAVAVVPLAAAAQPDRLGRYTRRSDMSEFARLFSVVLLIEVVSLVGNYY